jgi:hypothetical protein
MTIQSAPPGHNTSEAHDRVAVRGSVLTVPRRDVVGLRNSSTTMKSRTRRRVSSITALPVLSASSVKSRGRATARATRRIAGENGVQELLGRAAAVVERGRRHHARCGAICVLDLRLVNEDVAIGVRGYRCSPSGLRHAGRGQSASPSSARSKRSAPPTRPGSRRRRAPLPPRRAPQGCAAEPLRSSPATSA